MTTHTQRLRSRARLLGVSLLVASVALADPPADAPVQTPHTLTYPDGGRCENAAAARAEDKALLDAQAAQVKPVLAAAGVGFVVGVVLGVVGAVVLRPAK